MQIIKKIIGIIIIGLYEKYVSVEEYFLEYNRGNVYITLFVMYMYRHMF